jgi:hypothetical protein
MEKVLPANNCGNPAGVISLRRNCSGYVIARGIDRAAQ